MHTNRLSGHPVLLGGHTTDLRKDTCHSRGGGRGTEGPEALVPYQMGVFKRHCPRGSIPCVLYLRQLLVLTGNREPDIIA